MTRKMTIAALTIAAALLTISAGAMAATAHVERMPSATPMGVELDLHGFTVTSPELAGGPSATNYSAYYDSDGPNLNGLIRSYDDYTRYMDIRGVGEASVVRESSLIDVNRDDPLLTRMYGPFDYLFSLDLPKAAPRVASASGGTLA